MINALFSVVLSPSFSVHVRDEYWQEKWKLPQGRLTFISTGVSLSFV